MKQLRIASVATLAVALVAAAGPASAQRGGADAKAAGRAEVVRAVVDCRAMKDAVARLACYDAAADRLDKAERTGEVVVVGREQAQAARRQAFGFSVPALTEIFKLGGKGDEEQLKRATFTIDRAYRDGDGRWVLTMDNGQVWRQIDSEEAKARKGSKADIRQKLLGSYLMNIDGQLAISVRRER